MFFFVSTTKKKQIESIDISSKIRPSSYKIILYWTKYFQWNDFGVGTGRTPFVKAQCGDGQEEETGSSSCLTTTDRGLLNRSDAILFHARDLDPDDLPPPSWRRPHQNFIFFNYESPVHTDLAKLRLYFNNYFNRTMTYRRDSDIVSLQPYGRLKCVSSATDSSDSSDSSKCVHFPLTDRNRRPVVSAPPSASAIKRPLKEIDLTWKNRTAAWFVSNCRTNSRRESIVRNLSHYIAVDIYGNCDGAVKCSHRDDCDNMLNRHYRFYLSFENSLCPDYVTEKLYRALEHETVPVVFGGADYSAYLPPGSYVDARDFQSIRHLASHLQKLMHDDKLYLSHFRWRGDYVVDPAPLDGWCRLCRLLLLGGRGGGDGQEKTYPDIAAWWAGTLSNQSCFPPPTTLVSPSEQEEQTTTLQQTLSGAYRSVDYVSKIVSKLRTVIF